MELLTQGTVIISTKEYIQLIEDQKKLQKIGQIEVKNSWGDRYYVGLSDQSVETLKDIISTSWEKQSQKLASFKYDPYRIESISLSDTIDIVPDFPDVKENEDEME